MTPAISITTLTERLHEVNNAIDGLDTALDRAEKSLRSTRSKASQESAEARADELEDMRELIEGIEQALRTMRRQGGRAHHLLSTIPRAPDGSDGPDGMTKAITIVDTYLQSSEPHHGVLTVLEQAEQSGRAPLATLKDPLNAVTKARLGLDAALVEAVAAPPRTGPAGGVTGPAGQTGQPNGNNGNNGNNGSNGSNGTTSTGFRDAALAFVKQLYQDLTTIQLANESHTPLTNDQVTTYLQAWQGQLDNLATLAASGLAGDAQGQREATALLLRAHSVQQSAYAALLDNIRSSDVFSRFAVIVAN